MISGGSDKESKKLLYLSLELLLKYEPLIPDVKKLILEVKVIQAEKHQLFPKRHTLSGLKPSTFKDMRIAYSFLEPYLKLCTSHPKLCTNLLPPPQPNPYPQISWQKTFIGHKHPTSFAETASISWISLYESLLFTGSSDRLIKIWDTDSGAIHYSFHGHTSKIIKVLNITTTVISACSHKVLLWNIHTGAILLEFTDPIQQIFNIFLTSPSNLLILYKSGSAKVIDLESEEFNFSSWECGSITAACTDRYSPCRHLFTAVGKRICMWDVNSRLLACEFASKHPINIIKACRVEDLIYTGSECTEIWKVSEEETLKYWESPGIPLKDSVLSYSGLGVAEFCAAYIVAAVKVQSGFEIICKGNRTKYDERVNVIEAVDSDKVVAVGDERGNVTIWSVPGLQRLWGFRETGELSLLYGAEVKITHLLWRDLGLITGSKKGTHSFYGLGGREQYVSTPIQQFYSLDYLGEFTKSLNLCDFKLIPYKYQPEIPNCYKLKGYKNDPANYMRRYSYFKQQEKLITNEFIFEEDFIQSNSEVSSEVASENSVESLLEVNNELNCRRCHQIMMNNTKWCNDCGKVFHNQCYSIWQINAEANICLLCFKSQRILSELKPRNRANIEPLVLTEDLYQVGDLVVFIHQAFEQYLKSNPEVPLLDPDILYYLSPTLMKITNIEYLWPLQGTIHPISNTIALNLSLEIISENKTTSVYYILQQERFLILLEEYEQKLSRFQKNPMTGMLKQLVSVLDVSPVDPYIESPYKSIVTSAGRVSFWDLGEYERQRISLKKYCCIKQFTKSVIFLYHPTSKGYKTTICVPMTLQMIEQRLACGYYRNACAAEFDVELIGLNTRAFYGKKSAEFQEFQRIQQKLKEEIAASIEVPEVIEIYEFQPEFIRYLPWNSTKNRRALERTPGRTRKLRKLA